MQGTQPERLLHDRLIGRAVDVVAAYMAEDDDRPVRRLNSLRIVERGKSLAVDQ